MHSPSSVPSGLRGRLLSIGLAASLGAGTGFATSELTGADAPALSTAVLLAMELGDHYEGVRFTPYRDTGGIWTVCRGITGAAVRPGKTYTEHECKQLEITHYQRIEREAKSLYTHWHSYNPWVQASMLDMLYNLGAGQVRQSTHRKLANAGDLTGACQQMTRWVYGRLASTGQKVQLAGLVKRRTTSAELCADWGRDGHFSMQVASND